MEATKQAAKIEFKRYYVTNGETKVRCHYSMANRKDGRKCVTIYAKDYGHDLAKVFVGGEYRNDSDSQTDYFEHGRVNIFEENPLYAQARATAELVEAKNKEHWAKVQADREARRIAAAAPCIVCGCAGGHDKGCMAVAR